MSVEAKRARAEALRGELSALRTATAEANATQHELVVESQLDGEIARLEAEAARERETLNAATGDGSAAAAIAAMTAAATSEIPEEELAPVDPSSLAENKPALIEDLELPVTETPVTDAPAGDTQPVVTEPVATENTEGK